MDNYEVTKNPTPQEIAFQEEAKQIFDEIAEVLAGHPGWEINPVLQMSPKGITPVISLEKKPKSDIIVPDPPFISKEN